MPSCVKVAIKKTQVCAGDLRHLIQIYQRSLTVPSDPFNGVDVDYGENFTLLHDVRAAIQTPIGLTIFNDIGVDQAISHVFYVRYLSDVDTDKWIVFDGDRYDIVKVTNFEGRKLFLKMECVDRGDEASEASFA